MTAIFLLLALFVLLFIGVPVAVSLGLASILTMILFGDQSLLSNAQKFFHTMQVYPLLAVPFFVLAGAFMTTGGVARRMIAFANSLVGHFRGGLAMAALLASAFFASLPLWLWLYYPAAGFEGAGAPVGAMQDSGTRFGGASPDVDDDVSDEEEFVDEDHAGDDDGEALFSEDALEEDFDEFDGGFDDDDDK